MRATTRAVGAAIDRVEGPAKVRGTIRYAFEWPVDQPAYVYPVQSTIASGRMTGVDIAAATAEPGVLVVLTYMNAPRLFSTADRELAILQSDAVAYRGQIVGGVIAETQEIARYAASLVRPVYEQRAHDVELRQDRDDLYSPRLVHDFSGTGMSVTGSPVPSAERSEIDAALKSAAFKLDATYTTPMVHHNPMEPHANIAIWTGDRLLVYTSSQGVYQFHAELARLFGLEPTSLRIFSPHVGGSFGSKVHAHPDIVLTAMAAGVVAPRPVKLTLTRRQMFSQAGYRSPTIQRIEMGADVNGRLVALAHDSIEQTSKIKEFAENSSRSTRTMYAAPAQRTTQRLAALDVPPGAIMRAPGEATGMFALESAVDEMAIACGLDPIEFRSRNEPEVDAASGLPFSSRHLMTCLREGARRFSWEPRDRTPRARRDHGWLIGTGVAASVYPMFRVPSNAAIRATPDGRYAVRIGANDLGTGSWTALTQIAADALEASIEYIDLEIGDSDLPASMVTGGSSGIISWGSAILEAATKLRAKVESDHGGRVPKDGLEVSVKMPDNPYTKKVSMYTFGAQFAEVRVREETGEVRVPRMLGMFDAGRIVNPKTARSQLVGGMAWGLSMALFEDSVMDPRFGHVVNQDLASYHIAANADVGSIEAHWLDEHDNYFDPIGAKGIGEIGIVGTAAAIANAVYHATGKRVRDLPITLDKLLA